MVLFSSHLFLLAKAISVALLLSPACTIKKEDKTPTQSKQRKQNSRKMPFNTAFLGCRIFFRLARRWSN